MVAENPIPTLTPQQAAALNAFLEPGAALTEIAGKLGIGTVELVALLTSEPVAAALDVIRGVQQMQLEMAQTAAFAAATDALSKLLPKVQDAVEVRRTATAILRSIRPARSRTITHRPARSASPAPGGDPAPGGGSPRGATVGDPSAPRPSAPAPGPLPTQPVGQLGQPSTADTNNTQPTASPPAVSPTFGGFQGGRAPMECVLSSVSSNSAHASPADFAVNFTQSAPTKPARLAAAAGIPGPAP